MPRVLFSSLLSSSLPSRLSPNPHPHPITSQQIPIRRTHIPQLRLLAFRQPLISHTNSLPLQILRPTRPAIDDTRENTQDSKGDADGVSIIIIDRRRNQYQYQDRQVRVKKRKTHPVTYLGASSGKKANTAMMPPMLPKLTCHALPTDRRWWPPRFMLNQQTMMGMAP